MSGTNVMTYDKALKILGLSEGFTDDDLDKNHKTLAKKYHESNFVGKSEEEQKVAQETLKEINAAFVFFRDLKKRNGAYFDLVKYKVEIENKINSYWIKATISDKDLLEKVKTNAKLSCSFLFFKNTKEGLDDILKSFLADLKNIYTSYKETFFEREYISDDAVEEIDYNCNVETFYKQMLRFKDKYSRKIIFEKRVNNEIAQYRNYATCTDNLWKIIQVACVHNANIAAENNKYQDLDSVIIALHEEIASLFKLVDKINAKFRDIKNLLPSLPANFEDKFDKIKEDYDSGASLNDILESLNKLEKEIKCYQDYVENKTIIDGLYQKIVVKYNSVLASLNPVSDCDKIKEITICFQKILELFLKCSYGDISLDSLLLLDNVTFLNSEEDNGIVSAVHGNKIAIDKINKLYVSRNCRDGLHDEDNLFVLEEENGILYITSVWLVVGVVYREQITREELDELFVPLDGLIANGEYVGLMAREYQNLISAIYRINVDGEARIIYLDSNNNVRIAKEQNVTMITDDGILITEYEDKDYLMSVINLRISGILKREKNRK